MLVADCREMRRLSIHYREELIGFAWLLRGERFRWLAVAVVVRVCGRGRVVAMAIVRVAVNIRRVAGIAIAAIIRHAMAENIHLYDIAMEGISSLRESVLRAIHEVNIEVR